MKRSSVVALLLAPLITVGTGAATLAHGAGFAVFTQGASALGEGNAATAHTDSPSTVFYNPALMNKLEGTQIEAGTTLVYSTHEFHGATSTDNHTSNFPSTFYITKKFNNSFSGGFGVFNPFGLSTEWGNSWEGRYIATKSQMTTYDFNPAIAWQILPSLSVAAGVDFIYLDATLERRIPAGLTAFGPATETGIKFEGDGSGVGYNLGLALDITKALTLGVHYRSEIEVGVNGHASTSPTFAVPTSPTTSVRPLDMKGSTRITLPQQLTAALAYQVFEPLVLEAGIRWEGWSSFRELNIQFENGTSANTRRNWHDTLGVNFGGKYKVNDTVKLMAGYVYGSNAVPSYTFDPSIPDSDTHIYCVGTDLDFKPWKLDLSYAYQYYTDRKKNNDMGAPFPRANGEYKSDAHLFALSLGYRF